MGIRDGETQMRVLAILLTMLLTMVCSSAAMANEDRFETINRKVHGFNDFMDTKLVKPAAKVYKKVLPEPVRVSVRHFVGNLSDVGDIINNVLQGKPKQALSDLGRVLVNSSIGIGGLFDPASRMGLVDHDEDFSQTLAVWGFPRGPYIVIPGVGPSDVRDIFGRVGNRRVDPLRYYYPVAHRNSLAGLRLLGIRAKLLTVDGVVFGDKYIFYRDAYLQHREFLEKDGEVEDPFGDEF
jgi:phospholipid-binding lipoprotein MlaA